MDSLLTHFLVRDGLALKVDPFLLPLVGTTNFLIIKVVGVLLCAVILWDVYQRWPRVALTATACFVTIYAAIVLWNASFYVI